jgi:hypothetical protein
MKLWSAPCALFLAGCSFYEPPPTPVPREATQVDASIGHTWDAVIDLFAARNIPIRTIERASGLIASDLLGVNEADEKEGKWGSCGTVDGQRIAPNYAIYNVLVRGDSASATVRTTVRWSYVVERSTRPQECTSTYVWERDLEQDVKERAEIAQGRRPRYAERPLSPPGLPQQHGESATSPPAAAGDLPGVSAPPPAPAGGIRTNDQLLANVGFRSAVDDVRRLDIVTDFRELRPDTLTVDLGDGAFTSASTEYNLGRLYLAYRGTTDYSGEGALELQHDGRRVGLYVPGRLTWEAVR